MSATTMVAKLIADASGFVRGLTGAKNHLDKFDKDIKHFSLNWHKMAKTMGLGLVVAAIGQMRSAWKEVITLSEKGIKLVSDGDSRTCRATRRSC